MSSDNFKHRISVKVRFHEVDMLGVCNNAVYLNYFEQAKLDYIKATELMPEGGIFSNDRIFFMVHHEINYRAHARYDDELIVYSKISYIKNSSFGFDHLITNAETGNIIVDGKGVVAMVDPKTGKSAPLPDEFYEKVKLFDKEVNIIKK